MSEVTLQFELEEGADADALAAEIQQRLAAVDGVEDADAEPMELRFGVAETVAVIAASVIIIKSTRELVDELKGLVESMSGLKQAYVELKGKRVPLDEVT